MKNAWPFILFAATLLPLGYGHTLYGEAAAMTVLALAGMSAALFLPLFIVSDWLNTATVRRLAVQPMARLLFATPERLFVGTGAALYFTIAIAVASYHYGCAPNISDAVAQWVQARIMASGHMTLPAYPLGEFFALGGVMMNDTRYYSQYPPGHILMLLLGELLGAACAVNPLLGAASCVAIFYLAKTVYNAQVARIALLLCLVSPFLLKISAGFMNHATSLLFTCLFLLGFVRFVKGGRLGWALLAGFSLAYVGMTRPMTALGVALPSALYALYLLKLEWRRYLPGFACMAFAASLPMGFLLWFNGQTTGNVLTLAYQHGEANRYGFGPVPDSMLDWASQPEHTPWHAIGMMFNNLNILHYHLFAWPVSSLVLLLPVFIRRRPQAAEWLLFCTCWSLLAVYVPYYFQGWSNGPRFLYEIAGFLIILSAYGLARLPQLIPRPYMASRLGILAVCCILYAAAMTIAEEAGGKLRWRLLGIVKEQVAEPAIIFMPADWKYIQLAAEYYPITLDSRIIPAQDMGERNRELMALYPGYKAYRVNDLGEKDDGWQEITR